MFRLCFVLDLLLDLLVRCALICCVGVLCYELLSVDLCNDCFVYVYLNCVGRVVVDLLFGLLIDV